MKTLSCVFLLFVFLFFTVPSCVDHDSNLKLDEIGILTPGGQPEYLFFTKFSEKDARGVAEVLALATAFGRRTVFLHLKIINNPDKGDKGFTPSYFEQQLQKELAKETPNLTPTQKQVLDKFIESGKMVVAINQDRINQKGVEYKHFLPATWAYETAMIFRALTGISIKQTGPIYRNPANYPDSFEKQVIYRFTRSEYDKMPSGEVTKIGDQDVYRYALPVFLKKGCLGCHGGKRGEKVRDFLNYEKEGLKVSDLRAIISVTVPIK